MKKNIKSLMVEYINKNSDPLKNQFKNKKLFIHPEKKLPLIATERWVENDDKSIQKEYVFKDTIKRNEFLLRIFEYETKTNHHANFFIAEKKITISLITKNINMATELDREYANYADSVYKDVLIEWRKGERFKFIPC
jgi:pterin-4a-carbinolamine dehydratase